MNNNIISLFPGAAIDVTSSESTPETVACQAVDILSMLVGGRVERGEPMSPKLLQWYLDYSVVSLDMMVEHGSAPELLQFQRDQVATVRRRLALVNS